MLVDPCGSQVGFLFISTAVRSTQLHSVGTRDLVWLVKDHFHYTRIPPTWITVSAKRSRNTTRHNALSTVAPASLHIYLYKNHTSSKHFLHWWIFLNRKLVPTMAYTTNFLLYGCLCILFNKVSRWLCQCSRHTCKRFIGYSNYFLYF